MESLSPKEDRRESKGDADLRRWANSEVYRMAKGRRFPSPVTVPILGTDITFPSKRSYQRFLSEMKGK